MQGVVLIEGKELEHLKEQLRNLQAQNLLILKQLQELVPRPKSDVPDFISIEQAAHNYKTSKRTIYSKMKLFALANKRPIDRIWSGGNHLVNAQEFLSAMRLKGVLPRVINNVKQNSAA